MKATLGMFLAGAVTAYLFDPTNGRERRERVNGWVRPMAEQLRRTKDQPAESDQGTTERGSSAPAVPQTLKDVAGTVKGSVTDASSAVAARVGRAVHLGRDAAQEDTPDIAGAKNGTRPPTMEDYRAEVSPKPIIDPIPEGEPNDPTLVARVESELFEDGTIPKGKLNINAVNGVVTLRGVVSGEASAENIVARTRAIEGVVDVVDLLNRG
jgi:gas vesicle protein